jgi:hypothetical protein
LGDIIGATIAVVYPSDIKVVRQIIDEQICATKFKSHSNTLATTEQAAFFGDAKQNGGYYAHHYQLEIDYNLMRPQLMNARCELQIKTVLHDAWGAKTHDLTYKRAGALDKRLTRQAEVLGDVLAGIDQQSELLRYIIEGRWALDDRKSKSAKGDLLKRTLEYGDPIRQDLYLGLRSKIITSEVALKNKPTQDPDLQSMISSLDEFSVERRYDHSICQLFCLLAHCVGTEGMGKLAVDRAKSWLYQSTSTLERLSAIRFLALANFSFGDKIEAVTQCDRAVREFRQHYHQLTEMTAEQKDIFEMETRNSLAYYLADLSESDAGQKMQAKERALNHLQEAMQIAERLCTSEQKISERTRAMLMDTEGAVKIACATDLGGIRDGLRLCKDALDLMKKNVTAGEDQEFAAFFELHEIRAFQRILDFEQGLGSLGRPT